MAKEKSAEKKGGSKMALRITVGVLLALVAIGLLVLCGYGHYQYLFLIMTVFCALAMHEVMGVAGCKNKVLTVISMIVAGFVPIYNAFELDRFIPLSGGILLAIYILVLLILMLKMYSQTRFEHVVIAVFCSVAVPESVCCIFFTYRFMDGLDIFCRSNVIFVLLMAMYAAWLNDAFALFTGMAFGKHKLSPNISPKKSIEGAVGGILGTTVFAMVTFAICNHFYFSTDTIKWWMVLIGVPAICIMGICGDLSASVIKRNYGVKDFGTLFPEHGGVMDRIDSFMFSMPAAYLIVRIAVALFA